ncbi:MAG: hypothetical protein EXS22_01295 [Pedosphaera sp.]|nr:hypothetical protein [Pedosphaera sp.]
MPNKKSSPRKLSPVQRRDLDIEIGFLEGVVRRDTGYVEALQLLGDGYTRRGRFSDGLKVDRRLSTLCPDDPLVCYNLACSYSLMGNFIKAAASLRRAIAHGYRDFKWLRRDPDLEPLRQHALFQKISADLSDLEPGA